MNIADLRAIIAEEEDVLAQGYEYLGELSAQNASETAMFGDSGPGTKLHEREVRAQLAKDQAALNALKAFHEQVCPTTVAISEAPAPSAAELAMLSPAERAMALRAALPIEDDIPF